MQFLSVNNVATKQGRVEASKKKQLFGGRIKISAMCSTL